MDQAEPHESSENDDCIFGHCGFAGSIDGKSCIYRAYKRREIFKDCAVTAYV